ncbi:MAG TPA: hypothetical protein VGN68_16675 [Sphingopyxis sp.]|jgi:hypothetical protein|uniref:hypothetical protein n=1 Tax=Sphingopyxis sp. TaxID=1908224 RepID=UPI002E10EAAE|nr:hypothetical protein [Sphingopyxis sp.]
MTTHRGRRIMALGALALTFTAITGSPVAAQQRAADPFVRADASFSAHRLNRVVRPQAIGKPANCFDGECEWVDKAGVAHSFGGKLLAIKSVSVRPDDRRALSALGIGTARDRSAVLTRVRAFLPEIKIDCLEAGQAGEGEGIAACGGSFKKGGWIKLLFGPDNRLTSARIDAFQIN